MYNTNPVTPAESQQTTMTTMSQPQPPPGVITVPQGPPVAPINVETLEDMIFNAEIVDHSKEVGKAEEAVTAQKATVDHANVLLQTEEMPEGNRKFAQNLYQNFHLCQRFMSYLGRLPIVSHVTDDHAVIFEYDWTSCRGTMFFITFAFLGLITFMSMINVGSTMLNFPNQPENMSFEWDLFVTKQEDNAVVNWKPFIFSIVARAEITTWTSEEGTMPHNGTKDQTTLRADEMFIFRRNLASLIIIICLLLHVVVCDYNLFKRRNFLATYLTYWSESVEIMKIDAAGDAGLYSSYFLLYYLAWWVIHFNFTLLLFLGAPVSFALLWFRCIYPQAFALSDVFILCFRCAGSLVYLYVILCSKVYVFFFLFICKILRTTCMVWNERLETVFTAEERKKTRAEKNRSRTGYDHLFKDYVNILDLINGADTLFANLLESYFSVTLISIVFEVYYLLRPISDKQHEFKQARAFDMMILAIYLFNSIMVFYLVAEGAAEVGDAAADGLEIIRRQGIMGHRSDEEMHFMISLYMSYTGHFDTALTGGGYFLLNKSFLMGIAGAMISYIIIIFQFQPALGLSNEEQREIVGDGGEETNDLIRLRTLVLHVERTFNYIFLEREPGY